MTSLLLEVEGPDIEDDAEMDVREVAFEMAVVLDSTVETLVVEETLEAEPLWFGCCELEPVVGVARNEVGLDI